MADELIEIILQAVDNASSVFESVGSSAEQTGTALQTAFEEATAEVERLEQELADIEMGNIEGDFDAVAQELASAEAEAEQLAQAMDTVEQETNESTDAMSELGIVNSSMLLQLADQVGNIGSSAEGMAQEMNTAAISVGQLATQTGIAEPEMVSLINTISNATFPNDEAMLYVKSLDQIGVSSENLGQSATDLDKINDAFGLGANTVNSLGQELSVLGVDMNNVSSSFNALAYANANTVGGMQNYYNFLRKFDAQFNQLGLDVDQASVIIAAATHKFGGGKAAFSGLSDALKECDGDTRKLEEALGMQAGTLDHASEVTGQYEGQLQQLADEEAEHKTILDQIGAAWEDVSLSLSSVASPLLSVVGLLGQIGQFGLQVGGIKTLVETMKQLNIVQGISNALEGEGAIARVASAIGITTEAAAADTAAVSFGGLAIAEGAALWPILAIAAAIAALIVVVYEVGKAFGWWSDASSMIDAIWSGIQRLWDAFINHPDVQAIIQAITDAWNWLVPAVSGVVSAIAEFFGITESGNFDVVRTLIDAIGFAWQSITMPIRIVIGLVQWAINIFNQFATGQMTLQGLLTTIWTTITSILSNIFNTIISRVVAFGARMLTAAVNAGRKFVTGIVNQIRTVPSRVYSLLMAVVGRISSAIQGWINTAKSKVSSLISSITGPFSGVAGKISGALSGVVSAITAPFKAAWDTVRPIVEKIQGAMDLIGNAFGGDDFVEAGSLAGVDLSRDSNVSVVNEGQSLTGEIILVHELENVPDGVSAGDVARLIDETTSSEEFAKNLARNMNFQKYDLKVKQSINSRSNRARGV